MKNLEGKMDTILQELEEVADGLIESGAIANLQAMESKIDGFLLALDRDDIKRVLYFINDEAASAGTLGDSIILSGIVSNMVENFMHKYDIETLDILEDLSE